MNSPTCPKCGCVKGCQSIPSPCPILLAECIASGQVTAYQIEQHRALDAAIAQPEQQTPVRQPLTNRQLIYMLKDVVDSDDKTFIKFARAIEAKHGITTPESKK